MKLVIAAATVVALTGMSSSSVTSGVRLGSVAAPTPAAVEQPIPRPAQPSPAPLTAQRFASGVAALPAAPAPKPAAAPAPKPVAVAPTTKAAALVPAPKPAALAPAPKPAAAAPSPQAAIDPSSPEAIGLAQLWRARGAGAIDTLKQVVEEMAKSVRKRDVANVRNDCVLVGAIGEAITQSLPAPNKQVDTLFRQAANSIKAGALKCKSWGPGLSKSQTDSFLMDMKDAVNDIKATKDAW